MKTCESLCVFLCALCVEAAMATGGAFPLTLATNGDVALGRSDGRTASNRGYVPPLRASA